MTTKYMMGMSDMQPIINDGAAVLLAALEADGLLTCKASEVSEQYAVVVVEQGAFGRVWDRVLGLLGKEPKAEYVVVKRCRVRDVL